MAEIAQKIGGRIRELREERKTTDPRWTQDYLARQIDQSLTSSQVSRYERGEVRPGDDRLEQIAEILGTSLADLYAGPASERAERKVAPDPFANSDDVVARELRELRARVDEVLDRQAKLLARLDAVLDAQERQQQLLERRGQTGGGSAKQTPS